MLYLFSEIIVEWAMHDFYGHYKDDEDLGHHVICIFNLLIWTPVLILVSWLLTIAVEAPAKDLAFEVDV